MVVRNGVPLTGNAEGENIAFSIWKHIDVFKTLRRFATFVKNRMITGIVEVTQDPEQAGKMYARTYSNVWCNYKIA
jgi:hypothetical protein